jgi:translation initiation factor 2 alpha subunit (eIF-2alpha)
MGRQSSVRGRRSVCKPLAVDVKRGAISLSQAKLSARRDRARRPA